MRNSLKHFKYSFSGVPRKQIRESNGISVRVSRNKLVFISYYFVYTFTLHVSLITNNNCALFIEIFCYSVKFLAWFCQLFEGEYICRELIPCIAWDYFKIKRHFELFKSQHFNESSKGGSGITSVNKLCSFTLKQWFYNFGI